MKEVQKEREDSDFKAEKQREVLKKQMQKQKKNNSHKGKS